MTAIWVLLGIAVLFGGAIFALVVYAVRHDDSAARPPADTEVGRFSRRTDAAARPEAAGPSPSDGPQATLLQGPRASARPAGRGVEVDP